MTLVLVSTLAKSDPHLVGVPRALSCHASLIGRERDPLSDFQRIGLDDVVDNKKAEVVATAPVRPPLSQRDRGG